MPASRIFQGILPRLLCGGSFLSLVGTICTFTIGLAVKKMAKMLVLSNVKRCLGSRRLYEGRPLTTYSKTTGVVEAFEVFLETRWQRKGCSTAMHIHTLSPNYIEAHQNVLGSGNGQA